MVLQAQEEILDERCKVDWPEEISRRLQCDVAY